MSKDWDSVREMHEEKWTRITGENTERPVLVESRSEVWVWMLIFTYHIRRSSASQNNQIQFKKRYIAKVYDDPTSLAMVVGSAIHKMIELRLDGKPIEEAIQAGIKSIENVADYEIEYGKSGSRENMLKDYETLSKNSDQWVASLYELGCDRKLDA